MKNDSSEAVDWVGLRQSIEQLLPITIDQLSTFTTVCDKQSPRQAALSIRRDQSSVEKQLQTMERNFEGLIDEKLIRKPDKRGGQTDLTRSGARVLQLATEILQAVSEAARDLRRLQRIYTIRIGLTAFMIPLITGIERQVSKRFELAGVSLAHELRHVRTDNIQSTLRADKRFDFCLGDLISKSDEPAPVSDDLEFAEWQREEFVLLSNYKLGGPALKLDDLTDRRIPLILPTFGVIRRFVDTSVERPEALNIAQSCNDYHFGFDLLRQSMQDYCMICTPRVANHAKQVPGSKRLHVYRLNGNKRELSVGLFRRKGECDNFVPSHPLRMFWDVFAELAQKRQKKQGVAYPVSQAL
jgi:DNA-binding transcriptional LysR family regulator